VHPRCSQSRNSEKLQQLHKRKYTNKIFNFGPMGRDCIYCEFKTVYETATTQNQTQIHAKYVININGKG
jgi:hypothetical protein